MAQQQDKDQPNLLLVPRKQHCPHCGRYLGDSTARDGWTTQGRSQLYAADSRAAVEVGRGER